MNLIVKKSGPLQGEIRPPSDKSLTHRAVIFSSLADGESKIKNPLTGEDCVATLNAFRAMGVQVLETPDEILIRSTGRLTSPAGPVDCGNSGTTMRLLAGVFASQPGLEVELVGDESLSRRPMGRVVKPLQQMGADIEGDTAPLKIHGKQLKGIDYESPVASGQIKSCILLAGLNAEGETWVSEPAKSRDHTENMLRFLDVKVKTQGELKVGVSGGASWGGAEYDIPADISSAAFWLCAAAMIPESAVTLNNVGINRTRSGVLEVLMSAGAAVTSSSASQQMGEWASDLTVAGLDNLEAFEISGAMVPRLIDEIPVIAVMATQCHGVTKIRDAQEMRVKETDRIETTAAGLRAMGANVTVYEDGMDIEGPVQLQGAEISAEGDHRIGMAFAVAGLAASGVTTITHADSIKTSYPNFEEHLRSLSEA
jgi:3-phosphoshikimate 1-carboxyvinyltransferase